MRGSDTPTAVSGLVYGRLAEYGCKREFFDPVEGRRRVFTRAGCFFSDSRDLRLQPVHTGIRMLPPVHEVLLNKAP
jgi:hypothetical protein